MRFQTPERWQRSAPGNAGKHITGSANTHCRIARPVKPYPFSIRNNVDMSFKQDRATDTRVPYHTCTPDRFTGKFFASHPGKFPGMRGIERLVSGNRKRETEGISIKYCFFTIRCDCTDYGMALGTDTVTTDHGIRFFRKFNQTLRVFCSDTIPFQPFINQIRNRLKDR